MIDDDWRLSMMTKDGSWWFVIMIDDFLRLLMIIDDDYYDSEHKVEFLKYKDSKGDIIVDVNGLLLWKMIIDSLDDRIKTLIKDNDLDQVEDILMSEFIEIILNNI